MADIRCTQCGDVSTSDPCQKCYNINREVELETQEVTRTPPSLSEKLLTPAEYLDLLRAEFDGSNRFIFRIYNERKESYTVDEFLKQPAKINWMGHVVVCRDGFGWYLDQHDGVHGFPCPWNVPGPGEVISSNSDEELRYLSQWMEDATQYRDEKGDVSERGDFLAYRIYRNLVE